MLPIRDEVLSSALIVPAVVVALLLLAAMAYVSEIAAWLLAAAAACSAGFLIPLVHRRLLVVALVPASLLTGSALVPPQGRYLPVAAIVATLLVSSRADVRRLLRTAEAMPKWLARLLFAYVGWMLVTTVTSSDRALSLAYLVGTSAILAVAFVAIPSLPERSRLVRDLVAAIVLSSILILVTGFVLALLGAIPLYGKSVGLYFLGQATILGYVTPVIFLQNFGPYIGPATAPLALGVVAAIYLQAASRGRQRLVWTAAGLVIAAGLLATFSREGWLMAAIACLAPSLLGKERWQLARTALVAGLFLLIFFLAAITNVLSLVGRVDLTSRWYGPGAMSVLMNPNVTERGSAERSVPVAAVAPIPGAPAGCTAVAAQPYMPPGQNGPGAKPPWRDTSSDPAGWQAQWGAPPLGWRQTPSTSVVALKGFSSLNARLLLWQASAQAIECSPIVGYGLGTDAAAIVPYLAQQSRLGGATTHDTFLRAGVEMGLPGLAIYIALAAVAARHALSRLRGGKDEGEIVLAAAVVAITAAEFTGTLFFAGAGFTGFWLAAAVGLLAVRPPAEESLAARESLR